ncbi:TIGR03936 family radical SAM-associated protein [Chloroflexota bacterium]
MQRLRLRFCRGERVKYITHLDLMRCWERTLRRARMPLAYSEGFSPHPRMSLAVPLPLGVTSEAELMDIFLTRWVSTTLFIRAVGQQLPPGIDMLEAWIMAQGIPSLQSQVRFAEYKVEVESHQSQEEVESSLHALLSTKHLPWQHSRDTGVRHYDLRALIDRLWVIDWRESWCTLGMKLRCDNRGSGRPEQVAAALGFHDPKAIHRTKLMLAPA